MIRFILTLILLVTIQHFSFGQSKEDSSGVITDCKAYVKIEEQRIDLSAKDSIIFHQSHLIKVYEQTLDSTKFVLNSSIQDGKNLEKNATKKINSLNRQIKPLKKVLVIETAIIIIRTGVWFLFKV